MGAVVYDLAMDNTPADFMRMALEEAAAAPNHGDVPVGAVLVSREGEVVARDHNRREERSDPTAHAEMLVIADAARAAGDWRLADHTLYVTLEPCVMCSGALVWSRMGKVVYAAADLKAGGTWSLYNIPGDVRLNHQVGIEAGLLSDEASELLTSFFRERR